MSRMVKQKKSPVQVLKEKLFDIRFSDEFKVEKKEVSFDDILKKARKARETFTDEDLSRSDIAL